MRPFAGKKAGFTLIEIVVVISIIGILAAVSFPTMRQISGAVRIKRQAESIASELRLAQEMAQSQKTTYRVPFVSRSLFRENAKYLVEHYSYFTGGYVSVKEVDLPRGFDFSSDRTIIFSSSGASPPGGSGTIVLEDASGRQKKIIVSSAGRVRVE